MPHRMMDPAAPTVARENPREPIRNPGLHKAMTNPSYQCSALRSCRSSTVASATAPPFAGCVRGGHLAPGIARGRTPFNGGALCDRHHHLAMGCVEIIHSGDRDAG